MKSVARAAIAAVGIFLLAPAAMAKEGLLGGPGNSDCESEGDCGGGGPPTLPNIPQ